MTLPPPPACSSETCPPPLCVCHYAPAKKRPASRVPPIVSPAILPQWKHSAKTADGILALSSSSGPFTMPTRCLRMSLPPSEMPWQTRQAGPSSKPRYMVCTRSMKPPCPCLCLPRCRHRPSCPHRPQPHRCPLPTSCRPRLPCLVQPCQPPPSCLPQRPSKFCCPLVPRRC